MVPTDDGRQRLDQSDIDGEITIPQVLVAERPDIVFMLNDPDVVARQLSLIPKQFRTVAYVCVDGMPFHEEHMLLLSASCVVTMSDFSKSAILKRTGHLLSEITVIKPPADISRFTPISAESRAICRENVFPISFQVNSFVMGWVGRNQWRKQMWINYCLLSLLRSGSYCVCNSCGRSRSIADDMRHCKYCGSINVSSATPINDIVLWSHMPCGRESGDWSLSKLEQYYNINSNSVHYTDGCNSTSHIHTDDMPTLYQMWDILLFLSGGEGFGLPAWEAMSCSIPIVYSKYSSHSEFICAANAGLGVDGILQPEPQLGTMRQVSDVYGAVDAVLELYKSDLLRKKFGSNGRTYVMGYDKESTALRWDDIFKSMLLDQPFFQP